MTNKSVYERSNASLSGYWVISINSNNVTTLDTKHYSTFQDDFTFKKIPYLLLISMIFLQFMSVYDFQTVYSSEKRYIS